MGACAPYQGLHGLWGLLTGPRWGYDKVAGARYVHWLNGNRLDDEPEFLDGWDGHGGTKDKKISVAVSEYIQRRAAFWLVENRLEMTAEEVVPEALGKCFEDLYREWTALAEPAVGTVLARLEYNIRLRIDVEVIRDDFEFQTGQMLKLLCVEPSTHPNVLAVRLCLQGPKPLSHSLIRNFGPWHDRLL